MLGIPNTMEYKILQDQEHFEQLNHIETVPNLCIYSGEGWSTGKSYATFSEFKV